MYLIEQARAYSESISNSEEQAEVAERTELIRQSSVNLLEQHGIRHKSKLRRALMASPVFSAMALLSKMTPFQFADRRILEIQLNQTEEPTNISIVSLNAVPSKSDIAITIEGLPEFLAISKDGAHIMPGALSSYPGTFFYGELAKGRKLTLAEINRWSAIVDLAEKQYPKT